METFLVPPMVKVKTHLMVVAVPNELLLMLLIENIDICYNIRYFEQHGRDLSDPWSCRQSAIFHKYDFHSSRSTWLIVHMPHLLRQSLEKSQNTASSHPLYFHIRFIRSAIFRWRDYLSWRAAELKVLVRKKQFRTKSSEN
jgi:hypothetical protein